MIVNMQDGEFKLQRAITKLSRKFGQSPVTGKKGFERLKTMKIHSFLWIQYNKDWIMKGS
jgi:hypothetical protein